MTNHINRSMLYFDHIQILNLNNVKTSFEDQKHLHSFLNILLVNVMSVSRVSAPPSVLGKGNLKKNLQIIYFMLYKAVPQQSLSLYI